MINYQHRNILSPAMFGATQELAGNQAPALNAMTAFARETEDDATLSYAAWMSLDGQRHRITQTVDMTVFRRNHGVALQDGALLGYTSNTPMLDLTGSRGIGLRNLYFWGDATLTPSVGLLLQRFDNTAGGNPNPVASDHKYENLILRGRYTKAALATYANEVSHMSNVWCSNDSRDAAAYASIFTGFETTPRTRVPGSAFQPNVSGGQSFIQMIASRHQANRINDPGLTIIAITQANPAVMTYAGPVALVNGDVITMEKLVGMEPLNGGVFTVSAAGPGTCTLTGTNTTSYTPYVSSGRIYYRTGPCVYISCCTYLKFEDLYCVTYGDYHVVCERNDSRGDEGLTIEMHGEGTPLAQVLFQCNNDFYDSRRFTFRESGSQTYQNHFHVQSGGPAGILRLYSPRIMINRYSSEPSGKVFDHPELVEIRNGHIHLAQGKFHNMPNEFRVFTGRLSADDWNYEIVVGEERAVFENRWVDDFLKVADDSSSLTKRIGSSATATVTYPTGNGGAVFLQCGTGGGGVATDGVQLVGNQHWNVTNGGMSIEFDVSISNIAPAVVFIGFSDTNALEMPCTGAAGNVITGVADSFAGLFYDSAMDADHWWLAARKSPDPSVQSVDSGITPTTSSTAFNRFRIQFDTDGRARLYYNNGSDYIAQISTATTLQNLYGPYVAAFSRTVGNPTVRLARLQVYQRRATTLV